MHEIIIGMSLSEPHTNRYYEKMAVLMYVSLYPRYVVHLLNSCTRTCGSARTRIRAPRPRPNNVYDHFRLEMIVNINVLLGMYKPERGVPDKCIIGYR